MSVGFWLAADCGFYAFYTRRRRPSSSVGRWSVCECVSPKSGDDRIGCIFKKNYGLLRNMFS